jgi:transposase
VLSAQNFPEENVIPRQVEEKVKRRPAAVKLMTHPGVGSVTALAMVLTVGRAARFEP